MRSLDRTVQVLLEQDLAYEDIHSLCGVLRAVDKNGRLPFEVNERLWRSGCLVHLLDSLQIKIYCAWKRSPPAVRKRVWWVARRVGKTHTAVVLSSEVALAPHPGCPTGYSSQHFAAPTASQVRDFLVPTFDTIFEDCPDDLLPDWSSGSSDTPPGYIWPWGSFVRIAGCEDRRKINRLRGPFSDGFWIDEASYIPAMELPYLVNSVALYMTKGRPGSHVTLYSNAPESSGHSIVPFRAEARRRGVYIHYTIHDSPRYTPAEIEELAEEVGGKSTSAWIRESLAELCGDEDKAYCPEWTSRADASYVVEIGSRYIPGTEPAIYEDIEVARQATSEELAEALPPLIRAVPRPRYYDIYTSMDLGWYPDMTAVLTAYFCYERKWLVVEGEWSANQQTTDDISDAVHALEHRVWGDRPVMRRITDVNKQIQCDLHVKHHLKFIQVWNNDPQSHRDAVRSLVRRGALIVHPDCQELIAHLHAAYMGPNGKLARPSKEKIPGQRYYGHFDLVASLGIMCAHLSMEHDPRPYLEPGITERTHHIRERSRENKLLEKLVNG